MSKITIDLCAKYGNITGDKIVFPNLANYDMIQQMPARIISIGDKRLG